MKTYLIMKVKKIKSHFFQRRNNKIDGWLPDIELEAEGNGTL